MQRLRAAGFTPAGVVGTVASLGVDPADLATLAALPEVRRVRLRQAFRANLDANGLESGAVAARAAGASGANTLVAVFDSGIDYTHADFRDGEGRTRIRFLWDQLDPSWSDSGGTVGSAPPAGGEGTVYTEVQINAALESGAALATVDLPGHGTLAASAAAGNGLATGNGEPSGVYVGSAPSAGLLVVRIGGENASDFLLPGDVVAALAWVDARAAELELPVVVNMSFGGHIGPHDGTTEEEIAIDEFVSDAGRAVAVAAGNEGDIEIHASGNTVGSSTVEVFQAGEDETILIDCWIPGADRIDVGFTDPGGTGVPDLNVGSDSCGSVTRVPNLVTGCVSGVDPINGDREVLFLVEPASPRSPISAGRWKFTLRDEGRVEDGRFDCWSANEQRFVSHIDDSMRVSQPGTARGAITAGALVARRQWSSQAGPQSSEAILGDLASISSPGPTRDGRLKPDLVTGGNVVVGAWSIGAGSGAGIAGVPPRADLVASDGVHVVSRGTSFAAPQIAGAIALLFERNSTLTTEAVRDLLTGSARADDFTGAVPNDRWGFGKLDVEGALVQVPPPPPTPTGTAAATSTATPTRTPTETPSWTPTQIVSLPGDANCSGSLSSDDVAATVVALFDPGVRCSADCNRDGRTGAGDLLCVEAQLAQASLR